MLKATRLHRKHQKAPAGKQHGFEFAPGCVGKRSPPKKDGIPKARLPNFEAPNPFALRINGELLSEYLPRIGQGWVVRLVDLLVGLDWGMFFPSYKPTGRPPIHPRHLLGLVVYGLLLGRTSLRDLEMLARLDLGGWLVCAGLQPDHSSIGKFLLRHEAILTESYFEQLTTQLVARLKLAPGLAAVDGTVVAAVASRLSTLKLEAARQAAKEAAEKANALAQVQQPQAPAEVSSVPAPAAPQSPSPVGDVPPQAAVENPSAPSAPAPTSDEVPPDVGTLVPPTLASPFPSAATAEPAPQAPGVSAAFEEAKSQAAAAAAVARVAEARAAKSDHPERTAVVPGELDAVIQPLKNGSNHPSYKPSIIVHESGLIMGQTVHPSSETAIVASLRAQHLRILGGDPLTTLFDAGYSCHEILKSFIDQDILCPAGTLGAHFLKRGGKGLFGKSAFVYDEQADVYRCPGGQVLARKSSRTDRCERRYSNYEAAPGTCAACPIRARCTKAKTRTVSRFEGDDLKEAMAQVMAQPTARATFKQRAAIVEPVFAFLKDHQALRRFRRRGLAKVRLEFSLHCIAYNLGRALSVERRRVLVFVLRARLLGGRWKVIAIAATLA